jgi:hypothetical protein
MLKRLILPAALLLAITPAAFAQQPAKAPATTAAQSAQQKLTPEQQQAIMKFRQSMAANAEAITNLIDQGKAGDVWDQASSVAKQSISRNDFVSGVSKQRDNAGKLVSRKLAAVTHSVSKGEQKLPAGDYINVVFATRFSSEKAPIRELVSYHYDSDKVWRVSGYTLQQPATAKR